MDVQSSKTEPRELTSNERKAIRKLVTGMCANYEEQSKACLPLDCSCIMLNKWWSGSYCKYFQYSVLPLEPVLKAALMGRDISKKICPVCSMAYIPVTSRAYCSAACRIAAQRKADRNRKRDKNKG